MSQLAIESDAPATWLRRLPAGGELAPAREEAPARGAGLTLVCFPHAGGSAGYYLPLMRPLSGGFDVAVVQYPGRADRAAEGPVGSVRELARQVADELRTAGLAGARRLALFGHSMGALVAFETALLLERETGCPPAHLFVSGHSAPSRHRPKPLTRGDDSAIVADLRELGGTSEQVLAHRGLLRHLLPAMRTDYAAVRSYRYRPGDAVRCEVTALVGDRDPRTSLGDAQAWAAMTSGRFTLRAFPGGHFYLRQQRRPLMSTLERHLSAPALSPLAA